MSRKYDRAYMEEHAGFAALDPEDHRLVPQSGVKHCIFPDDDKHNAIWDYYVTTDGRHLFSACAEGDFAEGFILYEYFPESNEVKKVFAFDDTITHLPDAIKASKIHTALCSMPDGRVIFQSHTTAAAPGHPVWMPFAYRNHMWEGFQGSNIMIWDPKTGHVEDLGIPVPHESLYGGAYSARCNAYFSVTMMNGHVYRFDLDTRHVTDYGNLTESSCCCIKEGPDGHIYFASENGDFMRINTETLEYEDLGVRMTVDTRYKDFNNLQMMYGLNGPDGKLYIGPRHNEFLQVYDPATNTLEVVGSVMPEDLKKYPHYGMIYGFDFDDDGVLWYGLMTHPQPQSGYKGFEISFFLCSWDFLHGGEPINYGMMGSENRRVLVFSEAHVTGKYFVGADTNHWCDPIAMYCVDLEKLKADYAAGIKGPLTKDAYHYTRYKNGANVYEGDLGTDAAPLYQQLEEERERTSQFAEWANEAFFKGYEKGFVFKPWRAFGYEDAAVREITVNADGSATVICGDKKFRKLVIKEGELLSVEELIDWTPKAMPEMLSGLRLPASAGRRWLANATAAVQWHDGRYLVGTEGGLVGLAGPKGVYALGELGVFGPVHDICVTGDGRKAYGVAGAEKDLGMLFSYDDDEGLQQLGIVDLRDRRPHVGEGVRVGRPSAIAVSEDGRKLYIGSEDVKSCVVELILK
ncbi:MAG: hypothetical protein E7463_09625 [Ruminococcaceae bacterium]|nr:hypothetical protein [Oscillospiraceae bacterium]